MSQKKKGYSLDTLRHSLAHVLALAVKELYPATKFGIGPTIENGFYYDLGIEKTLSPEDLPKVEEKMKEIIRQGLSFKKKIVSLKEAKKIFKKLNQDYKLELLKDLEKFGTTKKNRADKKNKKTAKSIEKVSLYSLGDFTDLCRGPHVKNTKELPLSFKLDKISGAYWRGDEKNEMLQRVTGLAFFTEKELKNYLYFLSEAEKRDHRVLGQKLGLFQIEESLGPGLILWQPKGAVLKKIVEDYVLAEYRKNGYFLVSTPHIARLRLWEISGHTGFYKENMFPAMHFGEISKEEKGDYQLKPMNCPFHIMIYKNQIRSYKDLPLRYTELGTVYRFERSGTLHGLTRVRGFTQDDAHIWCALSQLEKELKSILSFAFKILQDFGFKEYDVYISTRPENFVGSLANWKKATAALMSALKDSKVKYKIDKGGGVFYGPKIDIKIKDSLGRAWQCTTIQVDFNLPEKFDMFFINQKGRKERPVMIHRALLGSIERFIGVLIEHYGGEFPLWLAPVQAVILPVKESNAFYAQRLAEECLKKGLRVEIWQEETLSKRIREAEIQKIPFILVAGDKEEKSKRISVREKGREDLSNQPITQLIDRLTKEAESRK